MAKNGAPKNAVTTPIGSSAGDSFCGDGNGTMLASSSAASGAAKEGAASAGVVRLVLHRGADPELVAGTPAPRVQSANWSTRADTSADHAVAELRMALTEGQRSGRLNPTTARKIEHSLAVIDTAIVEARRALVLDPNSTYLNHHLADTMRLKLEFLREANRIATART